MNYTTINHDVRLQFALSISEYCIADIIHRISISEENGTGWCMVSKDAIAEIMGISRNTTIKAIKKLVRKGLVFRNTESGFLRSTNLWQLHFALDPAITLLGYLVPSPHDNNLLYRKACSIRVDRPRKTNHRWAKLRTMVFSRDNYTCTYCGSTATDLDCDHIIPFSKGGTDDMSNLTTSCRRCNRQKKDKSLSEFIEWKSNQSVQ